MNPTEVVVRKTSSQGGPARTGVILSRTAGVARVRWDDDGVEEDARIGGSTTFAVLGSLRHQSLIDPGPLAERLEADPLEVVLQLLRESWAPMKAPAIKDQLKVLGLGQEAVDQAWRKVQTRLAKIEEIRIRKGAYTWTGPTEEPPSVPDTARTVAPERGPADEAEDLAEALRSTEDPEARAWSDALSWYATLLSGDTSAKEQFVQKFAINPWQP